MTTDSTIEIWSKFLLNKLSTYTKDHNIGAPEIQRSVLEKSGYLENFPHQVVYTGNRIKKPATCLSVYERFSKTTLELPLAITEQSICERVENTDKMSPFRLKKFSMLEYIYFGNEKRVEQHKEELETFAGKIFSDIGMPVQVESATDAFFLGESSGAKIMQKLKRLKLEYVFSSSQGNIALVSLNHHEDYFGKRFEITFDKVPTHSICLAFGLNRLAEAGRELWGTDTCSWPINNI